MPEGGTHHHHHYTSARLPGREQFSSVLVCIDSSPLTDVYLVPLFLPHSPCQIHKLPAQDSAVDRAKPINK